MKDNHFTPAHTSMHICSTSVGTEITIPGTNMVFCVDNVSYCDGEIKVEYSFEARTKKNNKDKKEKKEKKGRRKSDMEEVVFLRGCHTFDVSRFIDKKKEFDSSKQTTD